MSQRNLWILVLVALGALHTETLSAQDGLKEAQALLEKKAWSKARDAFDAILDEHPDSYEARIGMARACFFSGDPESGGFHAARAQKIKPDSVDAHEFIGRCFLAQGHAKREGGGDPTGLYEQAVESLDKALKTRKDSKDLWLAKGNVSYWLSRSKEAAVAYEMAWKLDPKDSANAYWAGFFYNQSGDKDKAGALFTAALTTGLPARMRGQATTGLWQCYGKDKNWDALIKSYEAWVKAKPTSGLALWWLGYVLNLKQDWPRAAAVWQKLEKVSSRYRPEAIFNQGIVARQQGDNEKAVSLLSKAAGMRYGWNDRMNPGLELFAMAGTLFGNGRLKEAIDLAESRVLPVLKGAHRTRLLSNLGLFWRDYGTSLEQGGRKKEARDAYVKARDYYARAVKEMVPQKDIDKPLRAQILNDYALMFHYHFDDLPKAIEYYRKALEQDKTNTDACLNLGRILLRKRELEKALRIAQQGKSRRDLDALISRIKSQMKK